MQEQTNHDTLDAMQMQAQEGNGSNASAMNEGLDDETDAKLELIEDRWVIARVHFQELEHDQAGYACGQAARDVWNLIWRRAP